MKIYFDPVSTAAREESARDLAARVLADPARKDSINTVRVPMLPLCRTLVSLHAGAQEPVCNLSSNKRITAPFSPFTGWVLKCSPTFQLAETQPKSLPCSNLKSPRFKNFSPVILSFLHPSVLHLISIHHTTSSALPPTPLRRANVTTVFRGTRSASFNI